ncbi:MAG: HAD-IA family hydrolase [Lachnospiraceae bacterium]|nr:HAD-IA family hydrolase [Lachnospiraceae bacterium]
MTKERNAILKYMARHGLKCFAPKAALVDMDGTLYDSMPNHASAWHDLMTGIGIECTRDEFFLYEGRTGVATINMLFNRAYGHEATPEQAAQLYHRKTELFSQLPPVDIMPGAVDVIGGLRAAGLETVLVTGSGQNTLLNRLYSDFPDAFPADRRVTSRDVKHGKPHPEPFLLAMEKVNVSPEDSIAIDNAPIGVQAGSASGAFTIGVVTGPIPESVLKDAGADIVYLSMEEMRDNLPKLIESFNVME